MVYKADETGADLIDVCIIPIPYQEAAQKFTHIFAMQIGPFHTSRVQQFR